MEKQGERRTVVRGVRATQAFWDKCDSVSATEGTDRNKLIVKVVGKYCDKKAKTCGK